MTSPQEFIGLLKEGLEPIETRCGLPSGRLLKMLIEDDDYLLVLKHHCILDVMMNNFLFKMYGKKCAEILSELNWDGRVSKLNLIKSHKSKDIHGYLRAFNNLRNRIVHDISGFKFTIDGGLDSITKNKLTSVIRHAEKFGDQGSTKKSLIVYASLCCVIELA